MWRKPLREIQLYAHNHFNALQLVSPNTYSTRYQFATSIHCGDHFKKWLRDENSRMILYPHRCEAFDLAWRYDTKWSKSQVAAKGTWRRLLLMWGSPEARETATLPTIVWFTAQYRKSIVARDFRLFGYRAELSCRHQNSKVFGKYPHSQRQETSDLDLSLIVLTWILGARFVILCTAR